MARSQFSLVNTSGNGPRRHWKTDRCARSESNTLSLALVWSPTFRLARPDRQRPDPPEHPPKHASGQVALGQHKLVVPGVPDQPPTRLDEALLEAGQRPRVDLRRQHEPPPQIPQVVREQASCKRTSFARKR